MLGRIGEVGRNCIHESIESDTRNEVLAPWLLCELVNDAVYGWVGLFEVHHVCHLAHSPGIYSPILVGAKEVKDVSQTVNLFF